MNDGLDGRETLAFGLAAGEVALFVMALMSAYAVLRSGLAAPIAWALAVLVAGTGALLAWGRIGGRPMVEWAALLAAFAIRTRHVRVARARSRMRRWSAATITTAAALRARAASRAPDNPHPPQTGAVVIPLALRRPEVTHTSAADASASTSLGPHVLGFFSLAGGTGRTTLAVEVAALLATRARSAAATGARGSRVVLLDLARRSPAVGLRLGMPPPSIHSGRLVAHSSGLLVGLAAATSSPADPESSALPPALIDGPECGATDILIVDFDCDLGPLCTALLRRCDQVLVTLTATARGVLDAYRSTAVLRRLGMREQIGYVGNRWRADVDLDEVMADLGGVIAVEIPEDAAVTDAENHHRLTALDGGGAVATAFDQLATCIEHAACVEPSASGTRRWGSHAG
ncbi:MAG: hypothetical protein M3019_10925 [Candidatus Dormibacteraeota bacterium]|nr:hypothetical protein [Candidatus Dormibacteraeota bacterium]